MMGFLGPPVPDVLETLIVLAVAALGLIIPLAAVLLGWIWLRNKRHRDEIIVQELVRTKQQVEILRDRLTDEARDR